MVDIRLSLMDRLRNPAGCGLPRDVAKKAAVAAVDALGLERHVRRDYRVVWDDKPDASPYSADTRERAEEWRDRMSRTAARACHIVVWEQVWYSTPSVWRRVDEEGETGAARSV